MLAKRTGKGRVAVSNADVERELALLHADRGSPAAVQALAAAIEERDSYTREHSDQVVHLARGVAMILGMPTAKVERIAHAALLHDVGKLGVPHEILHKRGPLTAEEWAVMADHPVAGERILLRIPELAPIAPIVRHEHEHWDGSGYPDGLRGRSDPDRLADHPRLRRLRGDDHPAALPPGHDPRPGGRRAARRRRRHVRPRGGRRAAGPARRATRRAVPDRSAGVRLAARAAEARGPQAAPARASRRRRLLRRSCSAIGLVISVAV